MRLASGSFSMSVTAVGSISVKAISLAWKASRAVCHSEIGFRLMRC
jgi:hypothetical protein